MKNINHLLNLPESAPESAQVVALADLIQQVEDISASAAKAEQELLDTKSETAHIFAQHICTSRGIDDEDVYEDLYAAWMNDPYLAVKAFGDSENINALNPYGCNQYGEGWKSPHNGIQSKPGKPAKKGDKKGGDKKVDNKKGAGKKNAPESKPKNNKKDKAEKEQPAEDEFSDKDNHFVINHWLYVENRSAEQDMMSARMNGRDEEVERIREENKRVQKKGRTPEGKRKILQARDYGNAYLAEWEKDPEGRAAWRAYTNITDGQTHRDGPTTQRDVDAARARKRYEEAQRKFDENFRKKHPDAFFFDDVRAWLRS